ncbi:ANTAR domain-containing response regulator [Aureimonas frigidaquae]|uniref:ANTAR domain protein n=1 Tax=Aureimonas frigidaquae TaxID=424757 RepID=A0A0P0Z3B3_9HYPH|nr:ANTAR domain-containing protein [Aureimonas frigidaquae]BAT28510.1 ANTAR domain protein [Aureimonas frigidaquae]
MRTGVGIPHLGGAQAFVLHREHQDCTTLIRQLGAIGLETTAAWPELPPQAMLADFVFFDADMGFDQQMPWPTGQAPMPLIAMMGSEAPGRIEWALRQRADAHLTKPLRNSGVYAALVIARQRFDERAGLMREIAALRAQVDERRTVLQALLRLTHEGLSEAEAYDRLRRTAMDRRITIEQAAATLVAGPSAGGARERTRRL